MCIIICTNFEEKIDNMIKNFNSNQKDIKFKDVSELRKDEYAMLKSDKDYTNFFGMKSAELKVLNNLKVVVLNNSYSRRLMQIDNDNEIDYTKILNSC
jgi:hypothetical protein